MAVKTKTAIAKVAPRTRRYGLTPKQKAAMEKTQKSLRLARGKLKQAHEDGMTAAALAPQAGAVGAAMADAWFGERYKAMAPEALQGVAPSTLLGLGLGLLGYQQGNVFLVTAGSSAVACTMTYAKTYEAVSGMTDGE